METDAEGFDWTVRNAVFASIVDTGLPPSVAEAAAALGVAVNRIRDAYDRLNARHAFFLTPGSHDIRMAHPFSGIPTPFHVEVGGRAYWANCAWDALGIPAALHDDARINARIGDDGAALRFAVEDERVRGWEGIVHFALPFRRWYDDLIAT
jgi:hypothetical protein